MLRHKRSGLLEINVRRAPKLESVDGVPTLGKLGMSHVELSVSPLGYDGRPPLGYPAIGANDDWIGKIGEGAGSTWPMPVAGPSHNTGDRAVFPVPGSSVAAPVLYGSRSVSPQVSAGNPLHKQ